LVPMGRKAQ